MSNGQTQVICHATSVSVAGDGVLIKGASGSGKSALALQLLALGAVLVSDDQTVLRDENGVLLATAPPQIRGLIEARNLGILNADTVPFATIRLVVELDCLETERLPEARTCEILGITVPCLHKIDGAHFPAAILQYLKGGRQELT